MIEIYLTREQLDLFREHCRQNPDSELVRALTSKGDRALLTEPQSVMDKTMIPPSGDKHDFLRMPTYAWPNPDTPDGLPYIHKDGQPGPHINGPEYDMGRMNKMTGAVKNLAWACLANGQEKYAEHAVLLLRVWFLDPATRMNPNLTYSKYTPGDEPPYPTGVIATHNWVELVQGFAFLSGSATWTDELEKGLQQWFSEYLEWLQTSDQGLAEKELPNNRGTWYDAQVAAFARFTGNDELALKVLRESCPKRLDTQIDKKGFIVTELDRTISLNYTLMTLRGWALLALMGERLGYDLWNLTTKDGRGLRLVFEFTGQYITNPQAWPHQQIKSPKFDSAVFSYRAAAQAYGEPKLLEAIKSVDGATEPGIILFP